MSDRAKLSAAAKRDLAASGGQDAPLEISDYAEAWPRRFSEEAERLSDHVPGVRWHHIGSTAVPGLAAKPVIDMMAFVEDLDDKAAVIADRYDYQYPAAYNATLVGRRWLCKPSASFRTHHLHLVAAQQLLDRHLQFRDALRASGRLAASYEALKRELADRAHDRESYTEAKGAFVRDALAGREPS